ncbi:MAG TPA: Hpt domain-containing protein [Myxococcota bacterium]|nr:Hpt domain-containing protein [Myxococcota bacterium]
MDTQPIYDPAMTAELLRIMGPAGFVHLFGVYVEETRRDLASLRDALARGDAKATWQMSHRIKGSSCNLGVKLVETVAEELIVLGRSGEIESARALFPRLERALQDAYDNVPRPG